MTEDIAKILGVIKKDLLFVRNLIIFSLFILFFSIIILFLQVPLVSEIFGLASALLLAYAFYYFYKMEANESGSKTNRQVDFFEVYGEVKDRVFEAIIAVFFLLGLILIGLVRGSQYIPSSFIPILENMIPKIFFMGIPLIAQIIITLYLMVRVNGLLAKVSKQEKKLKQ